MHLFSIVYLHLCLPHGVPLFPQKDSVDLVFLLAKHVQFAEALQWFLHHIFLFCHMARLTPELIRCCTQSSLGMTHTRRAPCTKCQWETFEGEGDSADCSCPTSYLQDDLLPSSQLLKSSSDSFNFSSWKSVSPFVALRIRHSLFCFRKSWRTWGPCYLMNHHVSYEIYNHWHENCKFVIGSQLIFLVIVDYISTLWNLGFVLKNIIIVEFYMQSLISFIRHGVNVDKAYPSAQCNTRFDSAKQKKLLLLTIQALSRLWSVVSVLTWIARELSSSACCINASTFGSSLLRNERRNLFSIAARTWNQSLCHFPVWDQRMLNQLPLLSIIFHLFISP